MPSHADESSEDEFEFSGPSAQPAAAAAPASRPAAPAAPQPAIGRTATSHLSLPRPALNQPYDEAVELSASSVESAVSADGGSPLHGKGAKVDAGGGGRAAAGKVLDADESEEDDEEDEEHTASARPAAAAAVASAASHSSPKPSPKTAAQSVSSAAGRPAAKTASADSDDEDDEDESDDEQAAAAAPRASQAKLYNAADFAHLTVSSDISDLFTYITAFKPADIELDTKFLPFIPDYIPAIGDIDAYLKVAPPQPDTALDGVGLAVLDEPHSQQSDASVLEMTLRVLSRGIAGSTGATVARIEHADRQPARVDRWIDSIERLHEQKPNAKVNYSHAMPDIEQLMQAWPADVEAVLRQVGADVGGLDLTAGELARLSCALLGIPVHEGKLMESLHVLFTLYHEFSNNSHFQQLA